MGKVTESGPLCARVASAPVVGSIASIVGTRDAGRQGKEQRGGNKYQFHLSNLMRDYAASNLAACTAYLGFHSRASFCASASCAGVILVATKSQFLTALLRFSFPDASKRAAARLNHMCASTWLCGTPRPL